MQYRPNDTIKDAEVFREFQRIGALLTSVFNGSIRVLHVAPEKASDGDTAICDGVDWNPILDGVKRPIWFEADSGEWRKFD